MSTDPDKHDPPGPSHAADDALPTSLVKQHPGRLPREPLPDSSPSLPDSPPSLPDSPPRGPLPETPGPPPERVGKLQPHPRPLPEYPGMLPATLLGEQLDSRGRPPRRSGRDWFIDITAFALALAAGVLLFATNPDRETASSILLTCDIVAGVLCCIALWWRRRWPVEIGILTGLISAFSTMSLLASTIALFSVAVHRRVRAVALVTAVSFFGAGLFMVIRPDHNTPVAVTIVVSVLAVTGTVAWGMFVRARRQLVTSLRERAERAEAEQQLRVSQARQLERTRIAREMHDVLAHRISLVSMHAGALEFRAEAVGGEFARSAAVIRSSAHQALEDLREVIGILRDRTDNDAPERPQPTVDDVPGLVQESQLAGMKVSLRFALTPTEDGLPLSVGRTAYRIVQEGLTNARKHAPGTAVTVIMEGSPGAGMTVEVRSRWPIDAGPGVQIPGSGQGLVGLAERTDLAGGRLEHGRTPDGDFRLGAWLPWPA